MPGENSAPYDKSYDKAIRHFRRSRNDLISVKHESMKSKSIGKGGKGTTLVAARSAVCVRVCVIQTGKNEGTSNTVANKS
jgi:hypothetical protein